MAAITVGTATANPGERVRGAIPVTNLPGGRPLEIPILVINGTEDRSPVCGDAVIHGDGCCFYAEIQGELEKK